MTAFQTMTVIAIAPAVLAFVPFLGVIALSGKDPNPRGVRKCLLVMMVLVVASVAIEAIAWLAWLV